MISARRTTHPALFRKKCLNLQVNCVVYSGRGRKMRLLLATTLLLAPHAADQGVVFQTSVAPKPGENIATDCRYEVTIPHTSWSVRAILVFFYFYTDMLRYY